MAPLPSQQLARPQCHGWQGRCIPAARPLHAQRCCRVASKAAKTETYYVLEATDATFQDEVLDSELPVLVDFWAPWCGPCRVVGPIVEQLAAQYQGQLKCVKVNTAESSGTAFEVGIKSIPTVVLYKGGRRQEVIVGAVPKAAIEQAVTKLLSS